MWQHVVLCVLSFGRRALDCVSGALPATLNTHTPQDRHLTTPRTPYAAYVKKL